MTYKAQENHARKGGKFGSTMQQKHKQIVSPWKTEMLNVLFLQTSQKMDNQRIK